MEKIILISFEFTEFADHIKGLLSHTLKDYFESQKADTLPEFLTRIETAKLLNISLRCLDNWKKEGKLIPKKIGRRVLYSRERVLQSLQDINRLIYK